MRVQIDGGSNVNILVEGGAAGLFVLAPAAGTITGISGGLGYTHRGAGECKFGPRGEHSVTMEFLYAPEGRRTIFSESKLLDHGVQAI